MEVLISNNILKRIETEICKCENSIIVITAFCKKKLIKHFQQKILGTVTDKKLIVRLRPEDILCGATDLSLYEYCKTHGWKMYFRLDLHAKTYVFDNLRCVLGSANATESGMSLQGVGNLEMATVGEIAEKDMKIIRNLFTTCVEMTDELYESMKTFINETVKTLNKSTSIRWPKEIDELFIPDYSILFAEDFPNVTSPTINAGWLCTTEEVELERLKDLFVKSKSYLWLLQFLKRQPNQEAYFGAITASLHNTLLNDPKPYRKDVKELLSNLLNWILELECDEISIDRPNYSQRVKIITH